MMKPAIFLVLLCLASLSFDVKAQGQDPYNDAKKSQDILNNLDSLLNVWYVKNSTPAKLKRADNIRNYRADEVPAFSDSVYAARIAKIESPLPLVYNSSVKGFIDLYAVRKRGQVERMLGLAEHYFPMMEEIFDKHNMPIEIKYLSIVESALNTRAVSRVGATGLWQFMYSTAQLYRVDMNSYVDFRRDPVRSTEAAAVYLKDLHNVFKDWFLAIAAYNCGPGNVNKAIRRSGGKRTFWEIYNYLPVETRGYVPAFIAATYVFHYHQEHNLYPVQIALPNLLDTVHITRELAFEPVSKVLNVPIELMRDLNPQYKRDFIPARGKTYALRLPAKHAAAFTVMMDSIYALQSRMDRPLVVEIADNVPEKKKSSNDDEQNTADKKVKVYYTVKSGDNISLVADVFDVTVNDIRRWNRLKSNVLAKGRRLVISVPADQAADYKRINSLTAQQKKNMAQKEPLAQAEETPKVAAAKPADKKEDKKEEKKDEKKVQTAEKGTTGKPVPSQTAGNKSTAGANKEKEVKQAEPDKQTAGAAPAPKAIEPAPKAEKPIEPSKTFVYEVQSGDTLWSIAQRFPGISVEDIKKVNNITDNRSIRVGQKIKITKG